MANAGNGKQIAVKMMHRFRLRIISLRHSLVLRAYLCVDSALCLLHSIGMNTVHLSVFRV